MAATLVALPTQPPPNTLSAKLPKTQEHTSWLYISVDLHSCYPLLQATVRSGRILSPSIRTYSLHKLYWYNNRRFHEEEGDMDDFRPLL